MRTSITLPTTLHQRLLIAAQYQRQSVTDLIRTLLDQALATQEQKRTSRMYEDLAQLRGIGPKGVTDASTTINDTLYGDSQSQRPAKQA